MSLQAGGRHPSCFSEYSVVNAVVNRQVHSAMADHDREGVMNGSNLLEEKIIPNF